MVTKDKKWWTFEVLCPSMIYNRFNREISCHHITVSLHHRITTSLCQSVICLAPCHQASQSFALPPATKPVSHLPCPLPPRHCITMPPHHRATTSPHHHVSQSFALPPATKPVSHLPCPLPPKPVSHLPCPYHCINRATASPCHCITALVSHLPCPLPPSQSVILPCPPATKPVQSFALPPATKPVSHLPCPLPQHHRISQSFALPPATKPVSHLPRPLPPNQSVICLAPYHCITVSPCHRVTTSLHHRVTTSLCHCITASLYLSVICLAPCYQASQSFALPPATKPVCHLPCPLPLHHCVHCTTASLHHRVTALVICLAPCHQASQSFALPPATKPVSHLPCPLPSN